MAYKLSRKIRKARKHARKARKQARKASRVLPSDQVAVFVAPQPRILFAAMSFSADYNAFPALQVILTIHSPLLFDYFYLEELFQVALVDKTLWIHMIRYFRDHWIHTDVHGTLQKSPMAYSWNLPSVLHWFHKEDTLKPESALIITLYYKFHPQYATETYQDIIDRDDFSSEKYYNDYQNHSYGDMPADIQYVPGTYIPVCDIVKCLSKSLPAKNKRQYMRVINRFD
jgi:hypothetical protein